MSNKIARCLHLIEVNFIEPFRAVIFAVKETVLFYVRRNQMSIFVINGCIESFRFIFLVNYLSFTYGLIEDERD